MLDSCLKLVVSRNLMITETLVELLDLIKALKCKTLGAELLQ